MTACFRCSSYLSEGEPTEVREDGQLQHRSEVVCWDRLARRRSQTYRLIQRRQEALGEGK